MRADSSMRVSLSSFFSTMTATECGTSSFVLYNTFSRMISAIWKFSPWSLIISSGKYFTPSCRYDFVTSKRCSTFSRFSADTGKISANCIRLCHLLRVVSTASLSSRSILFKIRNTGICALFIFSRRIHHRRQKAVLHPPSSN